ncbi:DNA-binding MarR family transcriptional regulator [Catenulispora sp. GAS73]|uniref:MarR family winged helix-turn-helix transcriptional regulator n=1 Tax=Catenulispora sp. GAS73 TaxID=3156269 RepID=UPI003517A847
MSTDRDALLADLAAVAREASGRALVLHQAIADRFGLGASDLKCLDLARAEPDLTAGRIADATGLSAAAVTALLDRLERAGFVERVRGTEDRRKVHVRSTGRHEAALRAAYGQLAEGFEAVATAFSDEQLRAYIAVQRAFSEASVAVAKALSGPLPT